MRVLTAVPIVLILALLVPSAGFGAACSPLDCGPSGTVVGDGRLLAVAGGEGKPTGVYDLSTGKLRSSIAGAVLSPDGRRALGQEGATLSTYDLVRPAPVAHAPLAPGWSLAGTSADGRRAVLFRTSPGKTRIMVDGDAPRSLALPGKFGFDGLLGHRLYLIQYMRNGYLVRMADISTGRLAPKPLKDAEEPALIQGQAWSRLASRDGRYLFTLYVKGEGEAMIHELDMRAGRAWCIDLPGTGDYLAAGSYALALSRDGRTLYAASGVHGVVATIDVGRHHVARLGRISGESLSEPAVPSASLSPDGKRLAFAVNQTAWLYDLRAGTLLQKARLPVEGVVAYSPAGRLWVAGRDGTMQDAFE
jgi:hypothetical protein